VREGRRGGGVLGRVGQKDWAGGKIRRGGGRWAELDGDGFVFFLKPFFKTFSNSKFKHLFNFSNFKTFQTLFFKFSNYFKVF
jgi:hypothetical protein